MVLSTSCSVYDHNDVIYVRVFQLLFSVAEPGDHGDGVVVNISVS